MTERPRYVVDLDDPRAPSSELWAELTEEERARVVDELPSEIESALPPEGDIHRILGLDFALEAEGLRLYSGTAAIPDLEELAARGEALLAEAMTRVEAAERRAEEEARHAEEEARRAGRAEAELARLRAELEAIRGKG